MKIKAERILLIVAVTVIVLYLLNRLKERYTPEEDEKVKEIVDELNISQEDLNLMFEMINKG